MVDLFLPGRERGSRRSIGCCAHRPTHAIQPRRTKRRAYEIPMPTVMEGGSAREAMSGSPKRPTFRSRLGVQSRLQETGMSSPIHGLSAPARESIETALCRIVEGARVRFNLSE
jgi:hypothetical protein